MNKIILYMVLTIVFLISYISCLVVYLTRSNKKILLNINKSFSENLNFKSWSTTIKNKIYYPEFCNTNMYGSKIPNINKVSLAFSGGSTRAALCATGILRGLHKMGYKDKSQYISSCSGSTFFMAPYFFCEQNSNISRDLLLGKSCGLNKNNIPEPSKITLLELENLNKNNQYYFGNITSKTNFLNLFIKYLKENKPYDLIFSEIAGDTFLKPYGINLYEPIALNINHANDIKSRNNYLNPIYCDINSPFWITSTGLFLKPFPYLNISMTPLYSGLINTFEIDSSKIGGYLNETFAFGNTIQPSTLPILENINCLTSNIYNLKKINPIRTLKNIICASSNSIALALYDKKYIPFNLGILMPNESINLLQKYNIWGINYPLKPTTMDSQCTLNRVLECDALENYDSNTCQKIKNKCYSITAPSCQTSGECTYSFRNFECVNKNKDKSSSDCYFKPLLINPFNCECIPKKINYNPYENARLSDGGYNDLLSIIPLIQREVKNIICFSSIGNEGGNYFCSLEYLFGIINKNNCLYQYVGSDILQIFNTEDYKKVIDQINLSEQNGGPIFARQKLRVLENISCGIKGNFEVDLLFIALNKQSNRFNNQLPLNIKNEIDNSLISTKKFNNFPLYSTFFQNSEDLLNINLEQANLLTTYCEWCIYQPELKKHIDEMFLK